MILLAVTVSGQRSKTERTKAGTQDHKSEATVKRSADRHPSSRTQQTQRVRKEPAPTRSNTTYMNRTQPVASRQKPAGTVRTYNGNNKGKPSGTVRTDNGSGKQKPTGTVRTNNGNGKNKPTATVRTNNGNGQGKVTHKPTARVYTNNGKGNAHAEKRKHYTTPNRKPVRKAHAVHAKYTPVKYRNIHHHYKVPNRVNVVWTHSMYRNYRAMYPDYHYWYYPTGYRIVTVPYYNAYFHMGEVRNVYGRVHEAWYSWSTDEYYLYFGAAYPYQDFTVIIEGRDARRFNRHPEAYFGGRYIWVTGLVSNFEGKPEIMVRRNSQIHLY